ncbi:putative amidohydrolase YtcJ [Microbacterium dextranolyticum]|nr:amidohydrolase family protein [Microbacterium dextranolyticum]MBM7463652.1 putative amidohydrolase YtcJ [Microbacterium dextranolyticum]
MPRSAQTIIETRDGEGLRTAIAVADGTIVALATGDVDDLLSRWRSSDTEHVRLDGVPHPAFIDTHNHLVLTSANELGVPMSARRSVTDILEGIRERAAITPAGKWIVTAADWHESLVAEGRLPWASELDAAAPDHPVLVQRRGAQRLCQHRRPAPRGHRRLHTRPRRRRHRARLPRGAPGSAAG